MVKAAHGPIESYCDDELGRTMKSKHPTKKNGHRRETETVLALYRRAKAAHRKTLHGQLANRVVAIGAHINTEKLSYKAF